MKKIGASVIGIGNYGQVHARAYQDDPRVELVSVWSRSESRSRKAARKFACSAAKDIAEIANDRRIQIVSIATPDFAHTSPAIKMMEAGKHVLVEKPLSTSVEECQKILRVQKQKKVKLMVNFHNRWFKPLAQAKELISSGKIGRVVHGYARLNDVIDIATRMLRPWAGNSGPEWFLFPHTVDLMRWLFGQDVRQVFAVGRKGFLTSKGIDAYDVVQAQLIFDDAVAALESSWILPNTWRNPIVEFKVDVFGEKGRIGITGDNDGLEVTTKSHRTPFLYEYVTDQEPIHHFIDCVLHDKQPMASGEEGLAVTRIIEAIVKSMETRKAVSLR